MTVLFESNLIEKSFRVKSLLNLKFQYTKTVYTKTRTPSHFSVPEQSFLKTNWVIISFHRNKLLLFTLPNNNSFDQFFCLTSLFVKVTKTGKNYGSNELGSSLLALHSEIECAFMLAYAYLMIELRPKWWHGV